VTGILWAVPWCWLTPITAWLTLKTVKLGFRPRAVKSTASNAHLWCVACFVVIGTVPMLPVSGLFIAIIRYMVDALAGVMLACTWGAWSLYTRNAQVAWKRRAVVAGLTLLAAPTIVVGLLVGFGGYEGPMAQNKELNDRIVKALSRCD
jgi:hypothetical protein